MLKVANGSNPALVSGALAGQLRECGQVVMRSVGVLATYKALKAAMMACNYLAEEGKSVRITPEFCTIQMEIDGQEEDRTAIEFELVLE